MKLEGKNLKSDFFRFVVPTLLSLLVYTLYATVDGVFVARGVDSLAVSAVNLVQPYSHLLFAAAILLAVGTSTVCAIFLGQNRPDQADKLFTQSLSTALLLGLLLTAAVFLFLDPVIRLLGATDATYGYVREYLTGLAPFSTFFILSYCLEVLVKTDGFPRLATISVTIGCLTNCVMDYLLIFAADWGVFGAGFATGFSQLVVSLLYLRHFLCGRSTLRLRRFHFDFSLLKRLVPIGVPDGVNEMCMGVMIFFYNRMILRTIGDGAVVSYTIISYVSTIFTNLMIGISQGSQPLISYYYGKSQPEKYNALLRYGFFTTAALSVGLCALTEGLAPWIVQAYIPDPSAALYGFSVEVLRKYCLVFLAAGFNILLSGFFAAVEYPRAAITISLCRALVLQGLTLTLMVLLFGGEGIWFAALVSELLCGTVTFFFLCRYKKRRFPVAGRL